MIALTDFDFSGGLTPDRLREFFIHCYRHKVSDIHLQSGSKIVVDHHGRKVTASQFPLDHAKLLHLIDSIYTPDIKAMVQSGQGADRPLQLEGDNTGRC
ncbi:hypothetical protein [Serratia bockelmannii]|uniref:hypothetical protein n=1 Tax=Serratia bockelmannii TaxID=2703793 RepID=UPI003CEFB766